MYILTTDASFFRPVHFVSKPTSQDILDAVSEWANKWEWDSESLDVNWRSQMGGDLNEGTVVVVPSESGIEVKWM